MAHNANTENLDGAEASYRAELPGVPETLVPGMGSTEQNHPNLVDIERSKDEVCGGTPSTSSACGQESDVPARPKRFTDHSGGEIRYLDLSQNDPLFNWAHELSASGGHKLVKPGMVDFPDGTRVDKDGTWRFPPRPKVEPGFAATPAGVAAAIDGAIDTAGGARNRTCGAGAEAVHETYPPGTQVESDGAGTLPSEDGAGRNSIVMPSGAEALCEKLHDASAGSGGAVQELDCMEGGSTINEIESSIGRFGFDKDRIERALEHMSDQERQMYATGKSLATAGLAEDRLMMKEELEALDYYFSMQAAFRRAGEYADIAGWDELATMPSKSFKEVANELANEISKAILQRYIMHMAAQRVVPANMRFPPILSSSRALSH